MNTRHKRKTLLAAGIATGLGFGLAGCSPGSPPASPASGSGAGSPSLSGAAAEIRDATSDTWITTKVKADLLADNISQGFEVSVETHDGVVVLEGTLPNRSAIDHVIALARGVDGVQRVDGSALRAGGGG